MFLKYVDSKRIEIDKKIDEINLDYFKKIQKDIDRRARFEFYDISFIKNNKILLHRTLQKAISNLDELKILYPEIITYLSDDDTLGHGFLKYDSSENITDKEYEFMKKTRVEYKKKVMYKESIMEDIYNQIDRFIYIIEFLQTYKENYSETPTRKDEEKIEISEELDIRKVLDGFIDDCKDSFDVFSYLQKMVKGYGDIDGSNDKN